MAVADLLKGIEIPKLSPIKVRFPSSRLANPQGEIAAEIAARGLLSRIKPGARIGITAGSRGVANLPAVIGTLVGLVRASGGEPFVFPAMGSHGGATAEGQKLLLKKLGITEETVGAPIESSMEVIWVGRTAEGTDVFMDRRAHESDGVIVVNRIKPHTSFRGRYESGMVKMLVIGMGKQIGAETCHRRGLGGLAHYIESMAGVVLASGKVLFGVGLIENAFHETAACTVAAPGEFLEKEIAGLALAKSLLPRIPFDRVDVLIMDEIGKEISGTGFDTNAVNRFWTPSMTDPAGPEISRLVVLDLTDKSAGNYNGLGMADVTTLRAYKKADFEETYPNALTSTAMLSVKIPMVMKNDELAIKAAIKTCCAEESEKLAVVRIKNTLTLDRMQISGALLPEVDDSPAMEIVGEPEEIDFDEDGNIGRDGEERNL